MTVISISLLPHDVHLCVAENISKLNETTRFSFTREDVRGSAAHTWASKEVVLVVLLVVGARPFEVEAPMKSLRISDDGDRRSLMAYGAIPTETIATLQPIPSNDPRSSQLLNVISMYCKEY